ncbi:MAG: hypothetical protein LBS79_10615 [Tannerella sp.]|nr:hypothetical protein [Tannerella sp.]
MAACQLPLPVAARSGATVFGLIKRPKVVIFSQRGNYLLKNNRETCTGIIAKRCEGVRFVQARRGWGAGCGNGKSRGVARPFNRSRVL